MTYLAFTIGPIYKTLLQAHRTREIWMASYLFSVVMEALRKQAATKGEIVLPADASLNSGSGAGIYPDRLIMSLAPQHIGIDVSEAVILPALREVESVIGIPLKQLNNYLHIHHLCIEEAALQRFEYKDKQGENIDSFVFRINYLLDNLELNAPYSSSNDAFFTSLWKPATRRNFLQKAFGESRHDFDSVLEISARDKLQQEVIELLYKEASELSKEEQKNTKKAIAELSKVHKYMAILRGDGDNFGKVVGELSKKGVTEVQDFSKQLTKYSLEVAEKIKDFGGTVIYIGGDDVLCFLPVENKGKTVFHLINELNKLFHATFTEEKYTKHKVSMSYGLSICYWKYPLNEALSLSLRLLNERAKKLKDKNCLAFQILLHSGQFREVLLRFGAGKSFESLLGLLEDFKAKDELLQSLTHTFVEDKEILSAILLRADYAERLNGYFENHFNENDTRLPAESREFTRTIKQLFLQTFEDKRKEETENLEKSKDLTQKEHTAYIEATLNELNTICRILKFIMPQDHA